MTNVMEESHVQETVQNITGQFHGLFTQCFNMETSGHILCTLSPLDCTYAIQLVLTAFCYVTVPSQVHLHSYIDSHKSRGI